MSDKAKHIDISSMTLRDCPPEMQRQCAIHEVGHLFAHLGPLNNSAPIFPEKLSLNGEFGVWAYVRVNNAVAYLFLKQTAAYFPEEVIEGIINTALAGYAAEESLSGEWEDSGDFLFDEELAEILLEGKIPDVPQLLRNGGATDIDRYFYVCHVAFGLDAEQAGNRLSDYFAKVVAYFKRPDVSAFLQEVADILLEKWEIEGDELYELSIQINNKLKSWS